MEDDARFHDVHAHHLHARAVLLDRHVLGARVGLLVFQARVHVPVAEVLDEERHEDARHADGGRRTLVINALDTLVLEHEHGVDEELHMISLGSARGKGSKWEKGVESYMDERRRDDDARAKLLQQDEQHAHLVRQEPHEEDGSEDAERAGAQHGEDEPDPERHVVLAVDLFALIRAAASRPAAL